MSASTSGSGFGVAAARLVAVPARAGLLAEAPHLAEPVGDVRVAQVLPLRVAALPLRMRQPTSRPPGRCMAKGPMAKPKS